MSFYGSIYYQLIDAFYKVVLRNKGKNSTKFIDTSSLPESFETQAAGRKSVFGFDTGNKWINLNERTEVNQAANEAYSIYEIYHGAPDTEKTNPGYGFKVILDDSALNNRTKNGIIQLDFNDEFETYETIYDDAGHISSSEKKVYRLPKSEVDERISNLEDLVGLPNGYKNLPEVNEKHQHLYGYVDENSKDIKLLENYVGTWSSIVGNWKKGEEYAPTISQVIGNIDDMYGSSFEDRIDNHKTFAEIIGNKTEGNLPALYKKLNDENPISLIKAILKEDKRLDDLSLELSGHESASDLSFAAIKAMIGTALDGETVDVYEHIAADREKIGTPIDDTNDIYDHITILYDNLNWPVQEVGQQKITVSGEISRLDTKIGKLDQTGEATVKSEIDRLDTKIGEIPEGFTSLRTYIDDNFEDIDEIFTYDLGTNYTEGENGIPTHTAFELIEENANNISSINTFIGIVEEGGSPDENSLITKITNLQNFVGGETLDQDEDSLTTHINNIKNYVGYTTPQDGKEVISLTNQINSIGELIGCTTLGEDDEGKKENNLITRIKNLESATSVIGTSTDTEDTLYGAINSANTSITNLIELVGDDELDEEGSNLITQLSNIHQTLYMDDQEKGKECLITQVGKLQNLIGTPDGSIVDSVFGQINNIKNDIGDVAQSLNSHDFGENITVNNIADVLDNILTRLEVLEEEVKNLKTETPNVPDSEEPENPQDEQEPNA